MKDEGGEWQGLGAIPDDDLPFPTDHSPHQRFSRLGYTDNTNGHPPTGVAARLALKVVGLRMDD